MRMNRTGGVNRAFGVPLTRQTRTANFILIG